MRKFVLWRSRFQAPDHTQVLLRVLDEVLGEDALALSCTELADGLGDLVTAKGKLEAAIAKRLRAFDRAQAYAAEGAATAQAWLRRKSRYSPAEASKLVHTARGLDELEQVAEAFDAGEIGMEHVSVITKTASRLGEGVVKEAQPLLLDAARSLDSRQLGCAARHLRHMYDPEGEGASSPAAMRRRSGVTRTASTGGFNNGKTAVQTTALVCQKHHRMLHQDGWRLVMVDGRPQAVPPNHDHPPPMRC